MGEGNDFGTSPKVDPTDRPGAPLPGLDEPPVREHDNGDAPPDFTVRPESPPAKEPKREVPEPPKPRPLRANELKSALEDFFGGISIAVMFTGDEYCASIIATQAEPLAEAWAELAKKNVRVRRMIEMLLQGSAWGQVITVTAATVIPIAAHHGLYPKGAPMPFTFGLGPPPPPSDEVNDAGEPPEASGGARS